MLPFFMLAMYEKHGQPLEKIVGNIIKVAVIRPKERPYQTNNFYAVLERQEKLDKEVYDIVPVSYTHLDVYKRQGQNRGTSQDLKAVSEALSYLRQKGISTVEDLEAFLESSGKSAADYRSQMKLKEARSKVIDGILASRTDCKECKPVYEKYQKIFFKKTKEKFNQEHPEVARFEKASAYQMCIRDRRNTALSESTDGCTGNI